MTNWKFTDNTHKTVFRIYDTGGMESASVEHQSYLDWLAEGNTPLPADIPTLAEARAAKKLEINDQAQKQILTKYPLWVQSNCANGIYPSAFATQMKADIAAVIMAANTATDAVMAAVDNISVNAVNPVWPAI